MRRACASARRRRRRRPKAAAAAPAAEQPAAPAAQAGSRLDVVKSRGKLICGVNNQVPGFGNVDANGNYAGFDVDFCKAVAAAVLGDANSRRISLRQRQ
jgi:general L-amino acid transport system substrate-binding protein